MKTMAIQDIEAGHGLAFIDPHGDPVVDLLEFIPKERIKDVIYIDPGDLAFPIAFNVMESVDFDYRHLIAAGLLGVFKKIWVDAWSARMEYILNNTILALLEYPGSTLLGINKMLASKEYRKKVVANITPSLNHFGLKSSPNMPTNLPLKRQRPFRTKSASLFPTILSETSSASRNPPWMSGK